MDARSVIAAALSEYRQLLSNYVLHLKNISEEDRRRRRILVSSLLRSRPQIAVETGSGWETMLDLDNTFAQHFGVTKVQFERVLMRLQENGLEKEHSRGLAPVPVMKKVLMFLWYMSTSSSFRAISEKFGVSQSSAHRIVLEVLGNICAIIPTLVSWPDDREKAASAATFRRLCGLDDVIGAIDGCHIRVARPPIRGGDYMNCRSFYSILLQAVVDDKGRFTDIFVGTPGSFGDARMLRSSNLYASWQEKMGDYRLLGDDAYAAPDFPFIIAPTEEDQRRNSKISQGRVVVERAFGRLKCRWRRLRDLQHTRVDAMVMTVMAGCFLHNICAEDSELCQEHPQGCPRQDDENE